MAMSKTQQDVLTWILRVVTAVATTVSTAAIIWVASILSNMYNHVIEQPKIDQVQDIQITNLKKSEEYRVELLTLYVTGKLEEAREQLARVDTFLNQQQKEDL